jgi:hypothetical protein
MNDWDRYLTERIATLDVDQLRHALRAAIAHIIDADWCPARHQHELCQGSSSETPREVCVDCVLDAHLREIENDRHRAEAEMLPATPETITLDEQEGPR